MGTDSATWRSIREDFESLPATKWSLIWTSRPPVAMFAPIQLPSQWTWFRPTDASLRTRASAIFLKAAKARGYTTEEQWLDELRYADFVGFRISGHSTDKLLDGTFVDSESGVLKDAVQHSITLCHQLEAGSAPKPIIGRLPGEAFVRMEAETAAFLADYLPKLEREASKSGPVYDAELLRELVIHQFNLVARECLAVCGSVEEFEAELRSEVAPFVRYGLSQYQWLAEPMRQELDTGFALFVMGANPWVKIPEKDRATVWHVGAITGEALFHAALKLRAEGWKQAADGGFPQATRPDGDAPTVQNQNGSDTDNRGAVDAYIEEVFSRTGKRITRRDIWKSARYKTRTEFERWERRDRRATKAASERFTRILTEKPHLK